MIDDNDDLTHELEIQEGEEKPQEPESEGEEQEQEQKPAEGSGEDGEGTEEAAEQETVTVTGQDGKEYDIPVGLKDQFLMQADYTRKTQALADQSKENDALKAAYESVKDAEEGFDDLKINIAQVDKSLKEYENVDWNAFARQDPAGAQAHMMQAQQMQMQRHRLGAELQGKEQSAQEARYQVNQIATAKAQRELLQAIPDFSQEMAKNIRKSTVDGYGFTDDEVNQISDPRQIQVLRDAMQWRKSQAAAKKAAKPKAAGKPTKTVKSSGQKVNVNPDDLPIDEWMKRENKRLYG